MNCKLCSLQGCKILYTQGCCNKTFVMSKKLLPFFCLLTIFLTNSNTASSVTLSNNQYRSVVIAINPAIAENNDIITKLQTIWTDASSALFVATKRRAYFGQITILVPTTWSGNYNPATSETYDSADILIADPNPAYQDQPYTLQYGDCGQPGSYIHLTPSYVLNDTFINDFGPKGKTLVHEWSHYRWGVFDETYTTGYNPYYFDSSYNVQATKCPVALKGVNKIINYQTGSTRDCQKNLQNGLMEDGCQFIPYEEQRTDLETSMMSNQYLQQVQTFCHDDISDPTNLHNTDAPNEQNRLCDLQSTWEVIMNSPDFAGGMNTPISGSVNTQPSFKVVQVVSSKRYVLVLDTSGSMDGERLEQMRQVVNMFISQFVADGDQVGIVEFSTNARILSYMVVINSQSDRDKLLNSIPDSANGNTCIGCGLLSAIKVLEDQGASAAGGNVIVLTDGKENEKPFVADVSSTIIQKEVIVNAIFFATDANSDLQQLVADTSGIWFFANDQNIQSILGAFQTLAEKDDGDVYSETFQVLSSTFFVDEYSTHTGGVTIDTTVGNSTVFTFAWSQYDIPINVVLEQPSGCTYSTNPIIVPESCPGHPLAETDETFNIVRFALPGTAEHGKWKYYVSTSSAYSQQITASVSSQAASRDTEPIVVASGLESTDIGTGQAVVVYAQVSQGFLPVLDADVLAKVGRPDGTVEYLNLYDAGAAPDVRKDDGVYSRYFTGYNNQGRYSVEVTVTKNSSTVARKVLIVSRANPNVGTVSADGTIAVNKNAGKYVTGDVASSDVSDFERVVTSEGFSYTGTPVTGKQDFFPPSKVIDLSLQQLDSGDFHAGIVLRFTAPGSDYDVGSASSYDIRYTMNNASKLVSQFNVCPRITSNNVTQGNLSQPQPAGTEEMFVVVPDLESYQDPTRISFAMKAIDASKNVGDLSNVPTITLNDNAPNCLPSKTTLLIMAFLSILRCGFY